MTALVKHLHGLCCLQYPIMSGFREEAVSALFTVWQVCLDTKGSTEGGADFQLCTSVLLDSLQQESRDRESSLEFSQV